MLRMISSAVAFAIVVAMPAAAAPWSGTRSIYLVSATDDEVRIGSLTFTADGDATQFKMRIDDAVFTNQFLSMTPFLCIDAPQETLCHLNYPYELRQRISADDLTDLEYALMFLFKKPGEFGINFWNGLYFELQHLGEGHFAGVAREVDLNAIQSPPPEKYGRPIDKSDLVAVKAESHRFPKLAIR